MSKMPTFDEDLDQLMRLGVGRRFLTRLVEEGLLDTAYNPDTNATYFNLGLASRSRQLNDRMQRVNPEAWLIAQRERMKLEEDTQSNPDVA